MNTSEVADLAIARLRSHEGRRAYEHLARRSVSRSVRIANAIAEAAGGARR